MTPTNYAVHVDAVLTNLSIAYLQNPSHFIASRVFPNVPVDKQSDRYYTFDRGDFNRNEARIRAPGAESAGSGFRLDNTPTYYAPVWAFHKDLPWQTLANEDAVVNLSAGANNYVMHKMMIAKEVDWMAKYFTSGVWAFDWTGVAASPTGNQVIDWSDYSGSDPIKNVRDAKTRVLERTGYEPNKLTIGQKVYDALVEHPDLIDRVKYSGGVGNGTPAKITRQALAALFEVDEVLVAKAIQNTGAEGAAEASSFIGGNHALLTYSPPAPGLMTPSAGYTFSWTGYMGQGNEFGVATKRIPMAHLESDRVEAGMAFDHKLVAADLGHIFRDIIA
jgi:hypothetical protein